MAISSTPIQEKNGSTTGGSSTGTITITAAASGNTLILTWGTSDMTRSISSIACTNVTWAVAKSFNTNQHVEIWYGTVAGGSSGTTITVTLSGNAVSAGVTHATEWAGILTTLPVNVTGSNSGSSTNPATGTITPTAGQEELLIALVRDAGGSFSAGPTNSFTALGTSNASTQGAYLVVSSTTGTYSTDWTYATSAWSTIYATFKGTGNVALSLPAAQGTFALNGIAANLLRGRSVSAAQGTFNLNGIAATMQRGIKITAAQGTFTLNGIAASLIRARTIVAAKGTFTLNGIAATFPISLTMAAAKGTYVLNGIAASPGLARSILAAQGTFTLSGKATVLNRGIGMSAAQGSYVVNGIAASLLRGRTMAAAQGTYVVNGVAASVGRGRSMAAAQGTFALNGVSTTFPIHLSLAAATGAYTINGVGVVLTYNPITGGSVVHSNPFFASPGLLTNKP